MATARLIDNQLKITATNPVEWRESFDKPVAYRTAIDAMERRVEAIRGGMASESVWLLEHPPLYTAGTSARPEDLLQPDLFPVHRTGRGGQYTYHGPGQIVGYVMMDLTTRGSDIRRFVRDLEEWLIGALAEFGVRGERRDGRVGIWINRGGEREDKIAAIGVRVRKWVSYHGIAFNVEPRLDHYAGIVPCGIDGHGVTSLVDLGLPVTLDDAAGALGRSFETVFGRTITPAPPFSSGSAVPGE